MSGNSPLPIPSGLRPSPLEKGSRPLKGKAEGDRKGRPYGGMRTGSVCSVKPGAEQKPHRLKFWGSQGPVAREETQIATQILRAGNFTQPCRYASPVMGDRGPTPLVKGRWPKARGDREGEYGHKVSILSRPPAILKVNCPEGAREGGLGHWVLSHRWESTSPRRAKPCSPPYKSTEQKRSGGGTPQGGFSRPSADSSPSAPALRGSSNDVCSLDCPLIRPSVRTGAPSPPGEGLKRAGGETPFKTPYHSNSKKFGDHL